MRLLNEKQRNDEGMKENGTGARRRHGGKTRHLLRREMKRAAFGRLKKHYMTNVLLVFLVGLLVNGGYQYVTDSRIRQEEIEIQETIGRGGVQGAFENAPEKLKEKVDDLKNHKVSNAQILAQTGQSILAQANQSKQGILSVLG